MEKKRKGSESEKEAFMRIQAGQNIKYIQGQLGHATMNMTLNVYGHLFNDLDFNRKQVELLESVRKRGVSETCNFASH